MQFCRFDYLWLLVSSLKHRDLIFSSAKQINFAVKIIQKYFHIKNMLLETGLFQEKYSETCNSGHLRVLKKLSVIGKCPI